MKEKTTAAVFIPSYSKSNCLHLDPLGNRSFSALSALTRALPAVLPSIVARPAAPIMSIRCWQMLHVMMPPLPWCTDCSASHPLQDSCRSATDLD